MVLLCFNYVFMTICLFILVTDMINLISLLVPIWMLLIPVSSVMFYVLQLSNIWLTIFSITINNEIVIVIWYNTAAVYNIYFNIFPKILLSSCNSLSRWLVFIKLILSNDVERNPGYVKNELFTFCNWNLNSLGKENFSRVELIEANNSLFDYDLISLCETSLSNTVELPDIMLENYTFISSNNPNNTRTGGVGLFYRSCLSIKVRNDLAFSESIVIEINIGKKRDIFFGHVSKSC